MARWRLTAPATNRRGRQFALDIDRVVVARFERPFPDVLYHYTRISGLFGIIDSQKVWATDCRYAKGDPEEFKLADLIIEDTAREAKKEGRDTAWKLACDDFIRRFEAEKLHLVTRPYIACFSPHAGIEDQWHEFADDERGACLGLQVVKRERPVGELIAALLQVEYSRDAQMQRLRTIFDELRDMQHRFLKSTRYSQSDLAIDVCVSAMLRVAAFAEAQTKEERFRAQEEWRLVVMPKSWKHPVEPSGPPEAPRQEWPLLNGEEQLAPIEEIVLGRNVKDPAAVERDLRDLLQRKGYGSASPMPTIRANKGSASAA